MRHRAALLAGLLCVVCLNGCRDQAPGVRTGASPTPAAPTSSIAAGALRLSPEDVAHHPQAILVGARVRPTADSFHVIAWWRLHLDNGRTRQTIATSDDGFVTATYERWSEEGFFEVTPDLPEPPAAQNLLAWPLPSFVDSPSEGTMAYALGGDGATLFPFTQTARTTDGGESWTTYDVQPVDGETGRLNGGVVLNDRRLLVLIGGWSDDGPRRPGRLHHGFWVSDGDDWGSFAPWEPTYSPPLEPTADGWYPVSSLEASAGSRQDVIQDVMWSIAHPDLLYVSTDDGQTFTAIPAR